MPVYMRLSISAHSTSIFHACPSPIRATRYAGLLASGMSSIRDPIASVVCGSESTLSGHPQGKQAETRSAPFAKSAKGGPCTR